MKNILIIVLLMLLLSGCQQQSINEINFEIIDNTLDIMTMVEFNELLYLATNEGLYTMDSNNQIKSVELIESLSIIHALVVTNDDTLYVGGMNGLIIIDSNGSQKYYDDKEDWLPDTRVLTVYEDNKGTVYIGTFVGLGILEVTSMTGSIMTEKDGLIVPMVNKIVITDDESLWLGSYNVRGGGITRIKNGNITYYQDELATIHITSILYSDNKLFFGGGVYDAGGMTEFKFNNSSWSIEKLWFKEDGFAGPKVRSLFKDGNKLYIGSEYNGVAIWNDEKKSVYTTLNGLPHDEVKSIIKYKGEIFFGTRSGLAKWVN